MDVGRRPRATAAPQQLGYLRLRPRPPTTSPGDGDADADADGDRGLVLLCALMSGLKRSLEEAHDGELPSPSDSAASQKPTSPASTTASAAAAAPAPGTGTGTGPAPAPAASASASAASSFRNVSACNRCRLRKNRCDQRLPSCASCDKAAVKCVGYDPITKREIPRSYV